MASSEIKQENFDDDCRCDDVQPINVENVAIKEERPEDCECPENASHLVEVKMERENGFDDESSRLSGSGGHRRSLDDLDETPSGGTIAAEKPRRGRKRKQLTDYEDVDVHPRNEKKRRAPNFSDGEKKLFLEVFHQFKNVLENKRTDAVSREEKNVAWSALTHAFNNITSSNYRSEESLKGLWDNLKKLARKAKAEETKDIFKTGGGPRASDNGPTRTDEEVLSLLGPSGSGLPDKYGGDRISMNMETINDSSPVCVEVDITNDGFILPHPSSSIFDQSEEGGTSMTSGGSGFASEVDPLDSPINIKPGTSWVPSTSVRLLNTPKSAFLQVKKEETRPSNLDGSRMKLTLATLEELSEDGKRKAELHELTVKKMKLEILQMKMNLGVIDIDQAKQIIKSEGL